jgi:gliding motility-associated-like protein
VIWSDGIAAQNRPSILPGKYNAVVTDKNNCAESIVVDVDYTFSFGCVVIPQVITPNNDGFNDEWRIKNIDLYPNAEVRVFNRWGKMVFSTKNLSDNPWDGRLNGKLVPTDSYHYILYLNDGSEPRSGVISVIR